MWSYLSELIESILRFLPSIETILPNERGILIRFGKFKRKLTPGMVFFWPLITEIHSAEVVTQVIDLEIQSLWTNDKKPMAISGAVEYEIIDIKKALLDIQDYDDAIPTVAKGIVSKWIRKHSANECLNQQLLIDTVINDLASKATKWGIKITAFYITDMITHRAIRLMMNYYSDAEE